PHLRSGFQIDHLKSVVADAGHEQTLAFQVDAEVIDASFYVWQGDAAFKGQNLGVLRGSRSAERKQTCEEQHCGGEFHQALLHSLDSIQLARSSYGSRNGVWISA